MHIILCSGQITSKKGIDLQRLSRALRLDYGGLGLIW